MSILAGMSINRKYTRENLSRYIPKWLKYKPIQQRNVCYVTIIFYLETSIDRFIIFNTVN